MELNIILLFALLALLALCIASSFQNINRKGIRTGDTNGGVYLTFGSDNMPSTLKKRLYASTQPHSNNRIVVPSKSICSPGIQSIPNCLKDTFTIRDGDRYIVNSKTNVDFDVPTPLSNLSVSQSKCFGTSNSQGFMCPKMAQNNPIDWTTEYSPGANNTYGDLKWHCQSPNTILIDNSMRCGEYNATTDLNPPIGVSKIGVTNYTL